MAIEINILIFAMRLQKRISKFFINIASLTNSEARLRDAAALFHHTSHICD